MGWLFLVQAIVLIDANQSLDLCLTIPEDLRLGPLTAPQVSKEFFTPETPPQEEVASKSPWESQSLQERTWAIQQRINMALGNRLCKCQKNTVFNLE